MADYVKRIEKLVEVGINTDFIGLHGTSIEAMFHLNHMGVLPSSGKYPGKLSFCELENGNKNECLTEVKSFAKNLAVEHCLLDCLPFEPDPGESKFYRDVDCYRELLLNKAEGEEDEVMRFIRTCGDFGIGENLLVKFLKTAYKERNGVAIALVPRIKNDFKLRKDEFGTTINVLGGLSIEYIAGIMPLGQYESKFIKELDNFEFAEVEEDWEMALEEELEDDI